MRLLGITAMTALAWALLASVALAQGGYPGPYPAPYPAPGPGAYPYPAPPPAGPYGPPYAGMPMAPAPPGYAPPAAPYADPTQAYAYPYGQDPSQATAPPAGQGAGGTGESSAAGSPFAVPPGWSPNPGAPPPDAVRGVPPLANRPGSAPPGTVAGPFAAQGPVIGPSGVPSAQAAPSEPLPPAPTVGGSAVDTVSIVDAGDGGVTLDPPRVRYPVNNPITWVNKSSQVVQIASEDNSTFDSGPLAPGESYTYTPTLIGSVYYRDRLHPWVRGVVVATR